MYKKINILAFLILFLMASACQKDFMAQDVTDMVITGGETVVLEQKGETKTVEFATLSGEWTIDENSYDKWLTVEKQNNKLVLTALANEQADERVTQVIVNDKGGKTSIPVTQFGTNPFISVDSNNGTVVYSHDAHKAVELNVQTNSSHWTVSQVDEANNKWLTYDVNLKENKLLLNLEAIDRNSEWAQTSRSTKLFLSNGNKHYMLNVVQNGYVQFQFPVWDLSNFNLNRAIELEGERNNVRNLVFERDSLLPYKEDTEKMYYVFHSAGEQAPYLVYWPNYYTKLITSAWIKAPKGKAFKKESYESWLKQNNFRIGNSQKDETEAEYYSEEADRTRLIHVYNDPQNTKMFGGIFKSSCMKYVESSNSLQLSESGYATTFPVLGSNILNNKKFKLEQIIAFEKTRGMKPDFNNQFNEENVTLKIQDPLCPYARLIFVPEDSRNNNGDLAYVIYHFNWQGVTEGDKDSGLRADEEYSGTVGLCQVFYVGPDVFYDRRLEGEPGVYEYYESSLKRTTRTALEDKGYRFAREDNSGFTTFYRGEEDLVDIRLQNTRTVLSYYQSKHYIELIKKNLEK